MDAVQRRMASNSRSVVDELHALTKVLDAQETLQWAAVARRDGSPDALRKAPTLGGLAARGVVKVLDPRTAPAGLLAITDRRLAFLDGKGKRALQDSIVLSSIQSTDWEAGMIAGTLTVQADGKRVSYTKIPKADGKEILRLLQRR